jgi:hypothetical protein
VKVANLTSVGNHSYCFVYVLTETTAPFEMANQNADAKLEMDAFKSFYE